MGQEGMHPTTLVDLHCVSFRVVGLGLMGWRGVEASRLVCSKEEGRGHDLMEGRRVGDAAA
jgi:hypothetical protein